jgi:hypothetical protein
LLTSFDRPAFVSELGATELVRRRNASFAASVLYNVGRTTDRRRALFVEMGATDMLSEPFCDRVAGKVLAELMGLLGMTASDPRRVLS